MKNKINVSLVIFCFGALLINNLHQTTIAQTEVKKQLVPTVTIPAPPGSKGFGMPQTNSSAPRRPRISASVTEPREIVTIIPFGFS